MAEDSGMTVDENILICSDVNPRYVAALIDVLITKIITLDVKVRMT